MAILIIETSTERGIVALYEMGKCLYMAGLPFGYHNSRFLVPKIEEGLASCQLKVGDLEGIGVGVGPGSYTGIRVGAITAKGLSFAKKIPLVGICTLKTFIPDKDGPFVAMIDAKVSGAYLITASFEKGSITWIGEPRVLPLNELGPILKDFCHIVTPYSEKLQAKLEDLYPNISLTFEETAPDPEVMAQQVQKGVEEGLFSTDGSLQLLYLREGAPGAGSGTNRAQEIKTDFLKFYPCKPH
jgi:tRNA threonylcarbamoyl adenosine modification protein YeaZ